MRWKISHHGHDPRLIDLLAILALLILIVAAWQYFGTHSEPPATRPSSYRAKACAGEVQRAIAEEAARGCGRNPLAAAARSAGGRGLRGRGGGGGAPSTPWRR